MDARQGSRPSPETPPPASAWIRDIDSADGHLTERHAQRLDLGDQQGGQESAADRTHAADYHDDEGIADGFQIERQIGRHARPLQSATQTGKKTAERKHAGKQPGLIDASAPAISRSCVAARISVPQRVRLSSSHNRASTTGPMTISTRSYCGKRRPSNSTEPARPGARGPNKSSGPHRYKAASLSTSTSAKVASSWNNSGAR